LARTLRSAQHLDYLGVVDYVYIWFNKLQIPPFVYVLYRYMYTREEKFISWDVESLVTKGGWWRAIPMFLLQLAMLFVVYDFFYSLLHNFLHRKGIYEWIHKHHHKQKAPSRGNTDAVNVHPVEFFLGEWNHLFALIVLNYVFRRQLHVISCVLFLGIGGVLATLNHTRYDVVVKWWNGAVIYDSKAHDVHHRKPRSNFGQYIMLWDSIWGTFRSYEEGEKVIEEMQIDYKTGRALNCESAAAARKKKE